MMCIAESTLVIKCIFMQILYFSLNSLFLYLIIIIISLSAHLHVSSVHIKEEAADVEGRTGLGGW